jgi:sarcosine oxidase subunit beta
MEKKYDAIVVGAGIIGCCIGFELLKKGYKTLNIDKLPAAGYGSTSGSCAIIRLHYSTPEGVAIAREGYYYWIDWPKYLQVGDEMGPAKYVNTGALVIKTRRNRKLGNVIANLDDLGVSFEEVSADEIPRLLPVADIRKYAPVKRSDDPNFGKPEAEKVEGAVYVPESGYITDPKLSTHNVQRAAEALGGDFIFNTEVTGIAKDNGRVVGVALKDGSEISSAVVVNVAGPHSRLINRMAGVEAGMRIKTRAIRVEVCHVPAPEGFDYENRGMMLSDGDIGNYSRPEVGNHILIGSEEPDCDELEYVDPDNYNRNFSRQWTTQVMRQAQRIRGLPIPNKPSGLVDLYDKSDDWIPVYDKSDLPGFYMAVGTSGNQYKNAPVVGAMMADLIEKCEAGHDHDRDPIRFWMKYTKRMFNVGFFSRLREIHDDSSFSVIG